VFASNRIHVAEAATGSICEIFELCRDDVPAVVDSGGAMVATTKFERIALIGKQRNALRNKRIMGIGSQYCHTI
jgi:hypothetical protein